MIILATTTESLKLDRVTAGSLDYTVYYADHTSTTFTANSVQGSVSSIGSTEILAAPAASTQRQVKTVIVVNRAITKTAQTVFIKKVSNSVDYHITPNTQLMPGDSLVYSDNRGFEVREQSIRPKNYSMIVGPIPSVTMDKGGNSVVASTRILANGGFWAVYVGKAPRNGVTGVQIRYRVTAAGVAILIAEVGLYVGAPRLSTLPISGTQGQQELQCVGYKDFSANGAVIGTYSATIQVGSTDIKEGDDVWVGWYNLFTTTGITIRANLTDDIGIGMQITLSASASAPHRQPSLDLGNMIVAGGLTNSTVSTPWAGISWIG